MSNHLYVTMGFKEKGGPLKMFKNLPHNKNAIKVYI